MQLGWHVHRVLDENDQPKWKNIPAVSKQITLSFNHQTNATKPQAFYHFLLLLFPACLVPNLIPSPDIPSPTTHSNQYNDNQSMMMMMMMEHRHSEAG